MEISFKNSLVNWINGSSISVIIGDRKNEADKNSPFDKEDIFIQK